MKSKAKTKVASKATDTTAYVVDKVTGRLVAAGPEEVDATQPLLNILIDECGWNPKQLVTRPQWKVPASPSAKREWPVDIAVFDDPKNTRDPAHLIIICECKRPDVETGIEQLKVYLDREAHARVGIWFNGTDHAIIYKTGDAAKPYEQAPGGTPILTPKDPLAPLGKRVLTYPDLRKAPSLVPVFKRIRDRLATLDRNVNRDEEILPDISLLLLLKILDEQRSRLKPKSPLRFQISETASKTAEQVRALLAEEVNRHPELFGAQTKEIRFQVDDESINYVVETLQNYRLLSNEEDAIADAFQVIRGKAYKGEEGQYFTPQSVVRIATAAVDPGPGDKIIDPACGSGSFLATALRQVHEHLQAIFKDDPTQVEPARRDWCTKQLFAIDKDSVSVRLSKAYLSLLGDGSTHVYKADSIRPKKWLSSIAGVVKDGSFDVVVTNPPFGTKLKVSPEVGREEGYLLSEKWKKQNGKWTPTGEYERRDLGLIMLERNLRLLKPGGRIAIVLPDTYLFSDTYAWLVQWLCQYTITHSINVPIEAFEPHCRAKTSIIVLRKEPPPKGHQIIGTYPETFGEDKHGRTRFKFLDGKETTDRDDEMAEASELLRSPPPSESKLFFRFSQEEAMKRGILVASYWWRRPYLAAVEQFARENDCDLVTVGDLMDAGELEVMTGHGSPKSHYHGKGSVPYVKVVDIKNWRVIENPSYAIPVHIADQMRGKRKLQPFDLVTATRASKNIGLFGVVMPWQTEVILTREIEIWRVNESAKRLDPWLLLTLMSLNVVHDQFRYAILMQMNREDLGERYREIVLPIPKAKEKREAWSQPIQEYFEASVQARESYDKLLTALNGKAFADRP